MSAPAPAASAAVYFDWMDYVIAKLEARKTTEALAAHIQTPYDALSAALGVNNKAATACSKLRAKRDAAWEDVLDTIEPFLLQTQAFYGAAAAPGVLAIFTLTVAKYAALPLKDFPGVIKKIADTVAEPATPAEVKKFAEPFLDARTEFLASLAALEAGAVAQKKATQGVADAKAAILLGNAKLRSDLDGMFPRQPKNVSRFFPKDKQSKAKTGAQASEAPAAEDETDKTPG